MCRLFEEWEGISEVFLLFLRVAPLLSLLFFGDQTFLDCHYPDSYGVSMLLGILQIVVFIMLGKQF
jgi:hypothetical protein